MRLLRKGKADKLIPESLEMSATGDLVPGPRVLPPALLANAYKLADDEERSEFVHNRKGCWMLSRIADENKKILREGLPLQTRRSSKGAYVPPPTRSYIKHEPTLNDFALDATAGEYEELGMAFVPRGAANGSGSSSLYGSNQPDAAEPRHDRRSGEQLNDAASRAATAGGAEMPTAKRVRFDTPTETMKESLRAPPSCTELIPVHMRGGMKTAALAQAAREATGARARKPPQTWQDRTDPSSRCKLSCLSELERAHREARKMIKLSTAELEQVVAEREALEAELALFHEARELLHQHGLPDTPREMARALVDGCMAPESIMSYRIADHVENCQRSK